MEPAVCIILYLAGMAVCFAAAFLLNESVEHEEYCMETEEKVWPKARNSQAYLCSRLIRKEKK